MTPVIISTGPVDPTITYTSIVRRKILSLSIDERISYLELMKTELTIGIPLRSAKKIPLQAVARIVSTVPMFEPVLLPYTAPNVRVGAITVMNINSDTATVF